MAKKRWKKKEKAAEREKTADKDAQTGNNRTLLIGGLIVILVAGYYFIGQPPAPTTTPPPSKTIKGDYILFSDMPSTHVPGKVVLVEFFDFYCSHCYRFHIDRWPVLKDKYGDQIELVDYGYPLRQSSIPPIEAYEIARDLGKGEEIKDAMFHAIHEEKKDISNVETLTDIAESVGLDRAIFSNALTSHTTASRVDQQIRLGNSYSLDQTPTIILDGNIKITDSSVVNLEAIIDSILEEG
jgi:thiol:disulfide interchange protein DsbA